MSLKCSCIVSVYNEEERISSVLDAFSRVDEINEIICIDDGSTDETYEVVKKRFPKVKLLKLSINQGKSAAIHRGLKEAKGDLIFLADADIVSVKPEEIKTAVIAMNVNSSRDMIILRRNKTAFGIRLTRADIIYSGERILKKKALLNIFKLKPQLYQIEGAINEYMIRNKKEVYWISSSAKNVFKTEKFGLVQGVWGELVMHKSIADYIGITNYIKQRLFFCHNKLPGVKDL